MGLNMPTAITCVKPSGCQSLSNTIRTSEGDKTVADIFEENEIGLVSLLSDPADTWYDLKKPLFVYDENNDLQQVTKLYNNGIREVFEITSEDGEVYKFTGNHRLKTTDGWCRVDELSEGVEIVDFQAQGVVYES